MTEQEQIIRLEKRVDHIENNFRDILSDIYEKLNEITVSAASNHCPAPGKCIMLETSLGSAVLRIERLELRMMVIERWRWWLTGFGFAAGLAIGYIFQLAKHLN